MEEGSLRCDANVSVRPVGATTLGTKAEVKNLNSFRHLQKALEFEIARQIDVLDEGGRVVQETRLWDASGNRTIPMRSKEEAHDYRYFPEPDLNPIVTDLARLEAIRSSMPELPDARRQRFATAYGLSPYDAGQMTHSRAVADFFEEAVRLGAPPKSVSNWMTGELARVLKDRDADVADSPVSASALAGLLALVDRGTISLVMAKKVFEEMVASGRPAEAIVASQGLTQIDDEAAIVARIVEVVDANPDAVAQVRAGKAATLGFLVGQVMRATAGKANPKRVNELLREVLDRGAPSGGND
jgi:aspartyl-tRNA(Asn)/glutamyl-tRNA(Gln) amidotransferase subunit B